MRKQKVAKTFLMDTSLRCASLSMTIRGVDSHFVRILFLFGLLRFGKAESRNDGKVERFYFLRKQNEAKTFDLWVDSPHAVILSLCKRRSIHFGESRIKGESLTLIEFMVDSLLGH